LPGITTIIFFLGAGPQPPAFYRTSILNGQLELKGWALHILAPLPIH
jgi:hypothetical protein